MKLVKLKIPIYNQLLVAAKDPEEILKYVKRTFKGDAEVLAEVKEFLDSTYGAFMQLGSRTHGSVFLINAPAISTLCHESVHAAWAILDYAGVECTAGNHEQLAYLTGFIFEEVGTRLDY